MYTIDEVSEMLKVNRKTISVLIKRGEIKSIKIGSQYRISEQQLQEYLKQNTTEKKEK